MTTQIQYLEGGSRREAPSQYIHYTLNNIKIVVKCINFIRCIIVVHIYTVNVAEESIGGQL